MFHSNCFQKIPLVERASLGAEGAHSALPPASGVYRTRPPERGFSETQMRKIERDFAKAMLAADAEARRLSGYTGHVFRRMMVDYGPYEAAKEIMRPTPPGQVQEGFTDLFMRKRLDLTVEWQVIQYNFELLFTVEVRREAYRRFHSVGCSIGRLCLPKGVTLYLTYPDGTTDDPDPVVWGKEIQVV